MHKLGLAGVLGLAPLAQHPAGATGAHLTGRDAVDPVTHTVGLQGLQATRSLLPAPSPTTLSALALSRVVCLEPTTRTSRWSLSSAPCWTRSLTAASSLCTTTCATSCSCRCGARQARRWTARPPPSRRECRDERRLRPDLLCPVAVEESTAQLRQLAPNSVATTTCLRAQGRPGGAAAAVRAGAVRPAAARQARAEGGDGAGKRAVRRSGQAPQGESPCDGRERGMLAKGLGHE